MTLKKKAASSGFSTDEDVDGMLKLFAITGGISTYRPCEPLGRVGCLRPIVKEQPTRLNGKRGRLVDIQSRKIPNRYCL